MRGVLDNPTGGTSTATAFDGCRATMNADTNLPSGADTTVVFDGADDFDNGGLHDPAVNPSRVTVVLAGVYIVHGIVESDAANGQMKCWIRKNGGGNALASGQGSGPIGAYPVVASAWCLVTLAAGDYVEFRARQDSGFGQNMNAIGTYFHVQRVR